MATSSAVDAYSLFTFGLIPRSLPHNGTARPFTFNTKHTTLQPASLACASASPACACWGVHTQAHTYSAPLLPQRYTHYHAALPQILHYAKPFSKATLNKEGTSNYHIHTHGASEQPACHTFTNEQHTAASLHPFWTDHRNNCHLSTTTKY